MWAVVSFFLGRVPFLGPLLTLVAWVWVINRRYPGGWFNAILIGFSAWLTVVIIIGILALLDITTFEVIGVPT